MIPSTIPQAAWWPLVGSALAHLLGDRGDEQRCRRAAIRALVDTGMPQLPAAHLLTLHTWDAEQAAKALAVEWADMLADIDRIYGIGVEPPMPDALCADPIGHSGLSPRDDFGRATPVQDRRRCHYCAAWLSAGDRRA